MQFSREMNNSLPVWNKKSSPFFWLYNPIQKINSFDIDDEQSFIEGRKFANDICQILQKEFANLEGWAEIVIHGLKAVDFQNENYVWRCSKIVTGKLILKSEKLL